MTTPYSQYLLKYRLYCARKSTVTSKHNSKFVKTRFLYIRIVDRTRRIANTKYVCLVISPLKEAIQTVTKWSQIKGLEEDKEELQ